MAAPVPTTRVSPGGIKLENGYQSLITFANDTDISLWEIDPTPPALMGGDKIDTTTQHNATVRTKAPRTLIDVGDSKFTAAYDPAVYTQCLSIINQKTTITIEFPDGSTLAFYGYLQNFEPTGLKEGEFPTATVTIVATNYDYVNKVEAVPVLASVAGT